MSVFSFRSFMVSGLTFKSLFHLELTFTYSITQWSSFILLHESTQFVQYHLLQSLSFLHKIMLAIGCKLIDQIMCRFILILYSVPLVCASLCQYHILLITVALQYSLKTRHVITPAFLFFLKIALIIVDLWSSIHLLELFILIL